jgi:iron complex outermembrane receptor protein
MTQYQKVKEHQSLESLLMKTKFKKTKFMNLFPIGVLALLIHPTVSYSQMTSEENSLETGVSKTDVPVTKQMISRSQLDASIPQDANDAVKDVAGTSSNTSQGAPNPALSIRGLQLNLYSNYRLNGGLPITGINSNPTENKEAVEVLKGANALQFGLANPAGIINFITKRATKADVSTVSTLINSFGQQTVAVDLGRKFGDEKQFGLRLNASDQHIESGVVGANGSGHFYSLAGDWQPTKSLSLKVDYENYNKDVIEQAQIKVANRVNGVIAVPAVPDPKVLLSGPWAVYRPRTENYDVRADYVFDPSWKGMVESGESNSVRLSRITDQIAFTTAANVASGAGQDGLSIIANQQYRNQFHRSELYGNFDTFGYAHQLTLGWSFSQRYQNIPNTATTTPVAINIYNPVLRTLYPVPTTQPNTTSQPTISADQGPYFYDSIELNKRLKLTVGTRFTNYSYLYTNQLFNQSTTVYKVTSPAIALSYELVPKTSVYVSSMSSFEDGGAAPFGTTNQYQVLSPTSSSQKEIGIKSFTLPNLTSTWSYFEIVRANNVTSLNANGTKTFLADGKVSYKGIETTDKLTISKYWSIDAAAQWLNATQLPDIDPTLKGLSPPGVPKVTLNMRVTNNSQEIPGLRLNAGINYIGSRFVDTYQSASIPAYAVWSAGAGYNTKVGGNKATFQMQIDNLTNLRYWSGVNGTTYAIGQPMSVRLNAKFDL